jgi:hypothetical protein
MRSVFMAILVAAAASGASAINCVSSGKVRGGFDEKKKKRRNDSPENANLIFILSHSPPFILLSLSLSLFSLRRSSDPACATTLSTGSPRTYELKEEGDKAKEKKQKDSSLLQPPRRSSASHKKTRAPFPPHP